MSTTVTGICVACDGAIEPEFLTVRPDARICLDCMKEDERRALEDDLQVAQEVNRSLLPRRLPRDGAWDVGVHYRPSRILSGDFYDFLPRPEPKALALAVGDVAGKGIPAGLLRSGLQATLRALSHEAFSPSAILERANRHFLAASHPGRFASVFYGVLDAEQNTLVYANGGHNPPLLRRATGEIEKLASTGTVLGAIAGLTFEERVVPIAPGDLLVLYTDGVTEAFDGDDRLFGEERLSCAVHRLSSAPAQEIANGIAADLDEFAPGDPSDDRTLVVFRRRRLS